MLLGVLKTKLTVWKYPEINLNGQEEIGGYPNTPQLNKKPYRAGERE